MDKNKKSKTAKTSRSRSNKDLPLEPALQDSQAAAMEDFEIQLDFGDEAIASESSSESEKAESLEIDSQDHELIATVPGEAVSENKASQSSLAQQLASENELEKQEQVEATLSYETDENINSESNEAAEAQSDEIAADDQDLVPEAEISLPFSEFEEIFEGELEALQAEQDQPKRQGAQANSKQEVLDQPLALEEALNLEGQVEAVLFAANKPLKATDILEILQDDGEDTYSLKDIEKTIQSLCRWYEERAGGFRLESVKGMGYQFQTVPAAARLMERLFASRPRPLSRAALETLSIIAYRQPVTRADVEYVRGVDAGSIIKNLLDRKLIACVGRKEDSGRPMLFGTTDEFLKVFRLQALSDLPPLAAFQPSPEAISRAMEDLDGSEEAKEGVDVETFIGDEEKELPVISEGLSAADPDLTDMPEILTDQISANDAGQEPVAEVEVAASEGWNQSENQEHIVSADETLEGAVFEEQTDPSNADNAERGEWNDQDSKVSVTDGTGLEEGGGKMDSGGARRRKRQGDHTARDAD